ncbi:protoporphyrinogen oxidase [Sporosarcina sp. PTS2304]|uniref:protoporphyrinogen oxidase n=1 Tax=Sporosarcina sp. PTS2304 TaxID=2283194 RepID=UPI000E0D8FA8|nr:protoporphyrinogen oxidase [Sporosarcina sp. PTS2304]AXH99626.1 protoporphyrinogen oxidase [Sporosarcina sp. PTS2304]
MKPLTIEALEICLKETEDTIRTADDHFLQQPISYLQSNIAEFFFVDSPDFDHIHVDSLALEVDDIFKTYMVLFGLQGKKKEGDVIRQFIEEKVQNQLLGLSISFSDNEGFWEINMPLDSIEGFEETMPIQDVLQLLNGILGDLDELRASK